MKQKHSELEVFKNNLFSVEITKETEPLLLNIGRWVKFKKMGGKSNGLISYLPFKIVHLQKDYKGTVCYRGENQMETFGRVLSIDEVTFITEDEAKTQYEKNILKLDSSFHRGDTTFNPNFNS